MGKTYGLGNKVGNRLYDDNLSPRMGESLGRQLVSCRFHPMGGAVAPYANNRVGRADCIGKYTDWETLKRLTREAK